MSRWQRRYLVMVCCILCGQRHSRRNMLTHLLIYHSVTVRRQRSLLRDRSVVVEVKDVKS